MILSLLQAIGIEKNDEEELILKKNFMVYLGAAMSMGGIIWGSICLMLGLFIQGVIPISYTLLTILNFYFFHFNKKFKQAQNFQVFISLCLPFIFQFSLGGFIASGGVMLWSTIALIATLGFVQLKNALIWLTLFLLLTITSGIFDNQSIQSFTPTYTLSIVFFVINFITIATIIFGLSYFFVLSSTNSARKAKLAQIQAEKANKAKYESRN
jgi:hypothetical protein